MWEHRELLVSLGVLEGCLEEAKVEMRTQEPKMPVTGGQREHQTVKRG